MKKLIAIAALFVGISTAVFAQDEGWKVGFMAKYTTDLLYATSVKEKYVNSPLSGTANTYEFGNYNKGTINFFGNSTNLPHDDNRLEVQFSNEGENYKIFLPIAVDDWVNYFTNGNWLADWLLDNSYGTDWYIRGNAGIFNGQIGTEGYGGFVDTRATWNGWLGWNMLCRFGVWRAYDGFVVADQFRTWNEWGTIVALGATFADNYKFSIGYRVNPFWSTWAPGGSASDSKSSINASFMFSGRPVDGVTFDLFYAVTGKDTDTIERPKAAAAGYAEPEAKWSNTIGAYVGLDIIDNLGISVGYAVNFNAYEAGGWWENADKANRSVTYKAPVYSGIDLHLNYNGIDKLGLTFDNNFSFAGVKGQKNSDDPGQGGLYFSELVYGLGENDLLSEGWSDDWFKWNTELTAKLGFIDGVGITVSLGDLLGIATRTFVNPDVDLNPAKDVTTVVDNELRVSVFADHGVGAVTVGAGLFFGLKSDLTTWERTYKAGEGSAKWTYNKDVVTFGIPLLFKVAF